MPCSRSTIFAVLALCLVQAAKAETAVVGVVGDFGVAALGSSSAAIERSVADLIKRWDPDFIVTLGDNNYPDGAASTIDINIGQFFAQYIHPYTGAYGPGGPTNRFFPTLGNHDWPAAPSIAYFTLPGNERYYTYRRGPAEFFVINSNPDPDGTGAASVQGQWLQARLAASTARWKLVCLHHPPYSSDRSGAGNPGFRWPFATWGASAVFAGHDHIYARIHTNGIPYFINGLGGHAIDNFGSTNSAAAVRYRSDYGAMRLEATESNLICQFVSRNNVVADTFVLGSQVSGPIILAPPLHKTVVAGRNASFDVLASGAGTLRYQWQRNSTNVPGATSRVLSLDNVQLAHEGDYRVLVSSGAFTNASRVARLTVPRHPVILQHPVNVTTGPGSNVTFSVAADGYGALSFQWFRDGAELPGATTSNLFLSSVQLEHNGNYAARVTDQLGAITSKVAVLTVLARPVVTVHPLSQSAAPGETIVLSAEATGTLPLSFSWRKNRVVVTNQIVHGNVSFFTLRNVQPSDAAGYQVGVTNIAGIAVGGISFTSIVTVLADMDADRMPDEWEALHSFSPDDPADALLDLDRDGQPNFAEYLAGTDPASSTDRLLLTFRRTEDDATLIQFDALSNKTYAVEFCEALHSDGEQWNLFQAFSAAPTNRSISLIDRPAQNRFYRLLTPNSQR